MVTEKYMNWKPRTKVQTALVNESRPLAVYNMKEESGKTLTACIHIVQCVSGVSPFAINKPPDNAIGSNGRIIYVSWSVNLKFVIMRLLALLQNKEIELSKQHSRFTLQTGTEIFLNNFQQHPRCLEGHSWDLIVFDETLLINSIKNEQLWFDWQQTAEAMSSRVLYVS